MRTAPVSGSTSTSQMAQPLGNTGSCISLSVTTAMPSLSSSGSAWLRGLLGELEEIEAAVGAARAEAAVAELDLVRRRPENDAPRSACLGDRARAAALENTVAAWRMERPECEPPPTLTTSVSPRMIFTVSTGTRSRSDDDLGEARLVALAARLRADHDVDAALRPHRDPRLLVGRADRGFDVVGEPEAEQLAALRRLALALLEALPVGDLHRPVHVLLVAAAVVEHADRVAVRHRFGRDQVLAPQLDAVDAEPRGGDVDQPLDREGHLRPAGAAIGLGRHGVGEDRHRAQRRGRNVVGAGDQARALGQRRERHAARADIADIGGAHGEEAAVLARARARPW